MGTITMSRCRCECYINYIGCDCNCQEKEIVTLQKPEKPKQSKRRKKPTPSESTERLSRFSSTRRQSVQSTMKYLLSEECNLPSEESLQLKPNCHLSKIRKSYDFAEPFQQHQNININQENLPSQPLPKKPKKDTQQLFFA